MVWRLQSSRRTRYHRALPGKLKFGISSDVTERVREVTIRTAPGTHCPWGHPHRLEFETDGK